MQKIFYGAGNYAEKNIQKWIEQGIIPTCFADRDSQKQGKTLFGVRILSLNDAIKEFPDYQIIISVDSYFKEVYDSVVACGIPKEKISFIVPREYRKGCRFLGKFWQYGAGENIRPCCYDRGYRSRMTSGGVHDHYNNFLKLNNEIIQGFRENRPTSCDGCEEITEDWWEIEPKLNCVSFATGFKGDVCNAKCTYCNSKKLLESAKTVNISTLDACIGLSQIADMNGLSIIFNNGEFSVNPDRNKIMHLWAENKWYGLVLTNAIKFEPRLADLMSAGLAEIQCSLDAGTQDTFFKIKGVDKFKQACKNLEEYSKNGCVTLKYIMLKNVNDNCEDVDGFVKLAKYIHAKVQISRDMTIKSRLTRDEFGLFQYFVNECKKNELAISSSLDVFNEQDIMRIKELL